MLSILRLSAFWGVLLVSLLVLPGCQPEGASSAFPTRLEVPASSTSGQPHLSAEDDGTVWVSWIERMETGQHALRYATRTDTSWSEPRTVAHGGDWFVNWADVPSLRPLPNDRLAAHYLRSNGSSSLAYQVRITQTTASGTWRPAVTPHDDETETEHGFVSLLPWPENKLLAVWLDGREMAGQEGHQGEMTLRGAVLDSAGTVEDRAMLDERTCECCPTSAVRVGDEALVAYRDRSKNEIRNIRLTRFDGRSWSAPTRLHDDDWQIAGCPVNGPALAARGHRVAAAWYTAPDGRTRVNVAFSDDGGREFSAPVVVAEGTPTGRVDVVLLESGAAVVSWMGQSDDTAALLLRSVRPDGTLGSPVTMTKLASASRGVGMPRLVRSEGHLYAAWTRPEKGGVQMGRLPVDAFR